MTELSEKRVIRDGEKDRSARELSPINNKQLRGKDTLKVHFQVWRP